MSKGGNIQAQGPSPNVVWSEMQPQMSPVTTLPSNLQPDFSNVPSVMTPGQLIGSGAAQERQLSKLGLNVDSSNPMFSPNSLQNYANQDYQIAMQPLLNNSAQNSWFNDTGGDTFQAAMLGNEAAGLGQQAFENAANYQNQNYNQLLGRRGAFFGQDVAGAQQQNAADIANMMNQDTTGANITDNRLGMLNTQRSNVLNSLTNTLGSQVDANLNAQLYNAQMKAAQTQSLGNLIGGGIGTAVGLGNGFLGRSGGTGSIGGGTSGGFNSTPPSFTSSASPYSAYDLSSAGSTGQPFSASDYIGAGGF